jgi:hypothetical protein
MENVKDNKKKQNLFYILIIFLLLGTVGYLAIEINSLNDKNKELADQNSNNSSQKETEKVKREQVELELQKMQFRYDTLMVSNDSMNLEFIEQKNQISSLLQKVKNKDYSIYKIKEEANTLRRIMKGYIQTIDSLNTLNINLQNTITLKNNELSMVQTENKNIKTANIELQETVAQGSILQATNITAQGIRIKNTGKQVETTRANRVNMLKGCFTLIENKIAPSGNLFIYLRIISPEGKVLSSSTSETISTNNNTALEISIKREINYQNTSTDVCIYYETEVALNAGNYIVEVYADNHKIGNTSFALK